MALIIRSNCCLGNSPNDITRILSFSLFFAAPPNCAAIASALSRERFVMASNPGLASSKFPITPRTAPPAPITSTRAPAIWKPRLRSISAHSPTPSVLSPRTVAPSNLSVFTAPPRSARDVSWFAYRNASTLKGTVTLTPAAFNLCAVRNASTVCAKPSRGASSRS